MPRWACVVNDPSGRGEPKRSSRPGLNCLSVIGALAGRISAFPSMPRRISKECSLVAPLQPEQALARWHAFPSGIGMLRFRGGIEVSRTSRWSQRRQSPALASALPSRAASPLIQPAAAAPRDSFHVRGREMRRIIVIGSGGAGKSTLAQQMGEILGLPVFHLDRLHWKPNWVSPPKDEWKAVQEKLCAKNEWIIDGNYGGTMDLRLAASDSIIFLDLPRWICLWRVLKRFLIYRGKSRPDMTDGCDERINREFFLWIWRFRQDKRPGILAKLSDLEAEKKDFILRNRREVRHFLETLPTANKTEHSIPRGCRLSP